MAIKMILECLKYKMVKDQCCLQSLLVNKIKCFFHLFFSMNVNFTFLRHLYVLLLGGGFDSTEFSPSNKQYTGGNNYHDYA